MPLQHPPALPHLHNPAHLTFRSPIALSSYHPTPTHESSAPGRGLMPGGAEQLSSGGGGQGRGAGGVTAEPSWVERPRRRDPGEVEPPSGWSPVARMSGRRSGRSLPCLRPPVRRGDVRPTGRADVRCLRVRCPGVRCTRCPDGQASGVRGAAAALSAPRWTLEWLGVGGRLGWRSGSACPVVRGRRGRLPASGLTGRMVRRWPWLARTRVGCSPGPLLGWRPGCGAVWPPGRHALFQCQGAGRVAGRRGRSRCSLAPAGCPGQSPAWCPTMGLDREVVTTLRGRWARSGPVSSSSGGPLGSVRSSPRPRCGRGA
jgi:hypothetical protein